MFLRGTPLQALNLSERTEAHGLHGEELDGELLGSKPELSLCGQVLEVRAQRTSVFHLLSFHGCTRAERAGQLDSQSPVSIHGDSTS